MVRKSSVGLFGGLFVALFALASSARADDTAPAADNKPTASKIESKEVIDQFLKSLQPASGTPEDSDRCPGETAADRDTEEPVPIRDGVESSEEPSENAASAELTDEPKTLPKGIEAAPIHGKTAKLEVNKLPAAPAIEPLTPELLRLKLKVRDTLGWYYDHPQKISDRSPWGVMHWLIPYGVASDKTRWAIFATTIRAKGSGCFISKRAKSPPTLGRGCRAIEASFWPCSPNPKLILRIR